MSGVAVSDGMTSSRTNAATRSRSSMRSRGSSKSMSALEILENRGRALPAANAHRDHAVSRFASPHLADELHGQLRAGCAERMAESDRAAVHVDAIRVHAQLPHHGQRLRAQCFLHFDEVDLIEFQTRESQRFRNS